MGEAANGRLPRACRNPSILPNACRDRGDRRASGVWLGRAVARVGHENTQRWKPPPPRPLSGSRSRRPLAGCAMSGLHLLRTGRRWRPRSRQLSCC